MKYTEFRKHMLPFSIFSINDARMIEANFDRRRLHEWCAKGHIRFLSNGYYLFADVDIDEKTVDLVANKIYSPSYVSLETVLSRSGFLPETVLQVTSVTTRKTRVIGTDIAVFRYRTVTPRLFFGYTVGPHGVKVARIEKAILDYLYLHTDLTTHHDYESLRIDRQLLSDHIDDSIFDDFLARFDITTLRFRAENFMKWVRYAEH